jgi:hypothetical protein
MLIVLAFANQEDDHLNLLKEESNEIRRALRPLEKRDFIRIEHEESTTTKELSEMLMDNRDEVHIFHYAGHAGNDELLLEDGLAHEQGLARILGMQKNLKLVFLNGCSTKGQVDKLFDMGVKAVIATSAPINDTKAKDFSIAFYKALTYKYSLKRAFEFAKGEVELRHRETPVIEMQHRKIGGASTPSVPKDAMPWGLYVQPEFEQEIYNFRLPYYKEITVSPDILGSVTTNQYITQVLQEMCRYNKDIYTKMVEIRNGDEVKRDSSYYFKLVFENFPLVIGEQIRVLKQMQLPNMARLEQLISTYIVTTQTLYYILLSNFWEEATKKKGFSKNDFLKKNSINHDNCLSFDYIKGMIDIYNRMKTADMSFFAPEMETLITNVTTDGHDTKTSYDMLEILRGSFQTMNTADIEAKCIEVEMAVANILWEAAFLVGYEIFSVRDIEIRFPRASSISYELDWGVADTNTSLFNDENFRKRDVFTNCDSVVMIGYGRDGDMKNYLNLSPFIVDKNTYHKVVRDENTVQKNRLIDLFLFRYEKDGVYYYSTIRHNYFIALTNEKGTDIVHTKMTLRDFEKGANITNQAPASAFKSSRFSNVSAPIIKSLDEIKPVFADLEFQFEQFKTAFTD